MNADQNLNQYVVQNDFRITMNPSDQLFKKTRSRTFLHTVTDKFTYCNESICIRLWEHPLQYQNLFTYGYEFIHKRGIF